MELSDGDLLNKSEEYEHAIDEQIPAIYTSEDERIPTPAVLSDTSRSPVFPDNRQKTVQPLKGDIKYTESNAYSLSIPTKKARLSNLPLDTLGQPLTIFSSDQPINISSQNQGHILEPSNDIKNPNLLTNEIKPESPILTERLIHVVQLPPEPTGHCSMVLQERVERAVRRMRLDISYDPNRAIQDNKAFRNPSIYEKLIDFLKIDEKGTNFSTDIYDPYRWSPQSYYEELAKVQNREIDRLMKIQKELKKSEVNTTSANNMCGNAPKNSNSISADTDKPNTTSGGSVLTGYIEPRKPSKWDSGIPSNIQPHETTSSETVKISVPSVGSLIKRN
ncbi:SAP30-binding protein [Schistosoma japonicum]|nr:SAP30-binding protein [Schistosoma japonicum]KAH8860234.1 SAP30-binding protein [Schistosoma japonicum]